MRGHANGFALDARAPRRHPTRSVGADVSVHAWQWERGLGNAPRNDDRPTERAAVTQSAFRDDQPDIDLTQLYIEPLIGLSRQNTLVPVVASRVPTVQNGDISRDGLTLTYHLRHDERFADGVPLTSHDVGFTYHAIMDPANPVSEVQPYRIIQRLDAPDRFTVVLHLRRPWGAAVTALFAQSDFIYGILPAHAFSIPNLSHAAWNDILLSGPFRVVQWRRGNEIVLAPNPYSRRKPHLRRLILRIVPDRNTELLLLRTHAVDVMDAVNDVQAAQVRSLPGLRLVRTEQNSIEYLAFLHATSAHRRRSRQARIA